MKLFRILFAAAALVLALTLPICAVTEINEENSGYLFDENLHTVDAPTAYYLNKALTAADFGADKLETLDDISVSADGSIYLADGGSRTVFKLSKEFKPICSISAFNDAEREVALGEPTGVFADRNGEVYVADRKNSEIYIFDGSLNYLRTIKKPTDKELISENAYEPLKVCVDRGGRVYVVSANQTQGIIQFSKNGKFLGFLGATQVQPSLWDIFIRNVATKKQKESLLRLIPTEYNNLDIDGEDFIYATISALDSAELYSAVRSNSGVPAPISRLNPKGVDVLQRKGLYSPAGDVNFTLKSEKGTNSSQPSKIIDVACTENGVYSILDSNRGRVFTYNKSGDMLFMFGGSGALRDRLETPTAIAYKGYDILVADYESKTVKVFSPTDYTKKLLGAIDYHENGEFDKEAAAWEEIKSEYTGSKLANLGLGRMQLSLGNYKEAMKYFRLAGNKEYYSKAFKLYRKNWGYSNIGWIISAIAAFSGLLVVIKRFVKKHFNAESPKTLGDRVLYGEYVLFHPFKGFWNLKAAGVGTVLSATVILLSVAALMLLQNLTVPYLFAPDTGNNNILFQDFTGVILLTLLFVISNWCFTSLMDGKGRMKDIYIYTCYSLTPLIFVLPINIILKNLLSADEIVICSFLTGIAVFAVGLLIFAGTLVVHEYGGGKTVAMLVLTVIGMMIIVFIILLIITVAQQMGIFAGNIINEIKLR